MWFKLRVSIGGEHELIEELRIQKSWIRLSGLGTVAGVLGKTWDRNFLPDLETHLEVFRDLIQIVSELIRCRWPIERGIIAHSAKEWFTVVEILAILA